MGHAGPRARTELSPSKLYGAPQGHSFRTLIFFPCLLLSCHHRPYGDKPGVPLTLAFLCAASTADRNLLYAGNDSDSRKRSNQQQYDQRLKEQDAGMDGRYMSSIGSSAGSPSKDGHGEDDTGEFSGYGVDDLARLHSSPARSLKSLLPQVVCGCGCGCGCARACAFLRA
jgi:hypothetical protein